MSEFTTLFKAEWGSRAYGTNNEHSDHDVIQIVVEPESCVTGINEFRPVHESTAGIGQRSHAGDTDVVTYGLKKFAALAVVGNPQVMATLWIENYMHKDPLFDLLIDNRDICVSKMSGQKYLGYMQSQRMNLEGLKKGKTNRPELVHTYGYDTKFAMHAVRLGLQGIELMTTQHITLPLRDVHRELCLDIREGKLSKTECLDLIYSLEDQLKAVLNTSALPETGDKDEMNEILHEIYLNDWGFRDA